MNHNDHYATFFLSQPRMPAPATPRARARRRGSFVTRARRAFAAR